MVLINDAVAAEHVSGVAGDRESFTAVVTLHDRDHLRCQLASILELRNSVDAVQAERNFSQHVSHFQLWDLHLCERLAELLPLHGVVAGGVEAELGSAHGSPRDTESGLVEAAEGSLESLHVQHVLFGNFDVIEHDHASRRGAQGMLAFDLGRRDSLHGVLLEDEASDIACFILGPDDEDASVRRVCDPGLASVEHEVVALVDSLRAHLTRVGARVWLSQTEAADKLGSGEFGNQAIFDRLVRECVDGVHDEG
mmetsp:Transcript_15780/g.21356  ORF Transcript_15780/g.21356 Transcript_15780/m.21356 type:complete len:253 (-) Transcript_15780:423-1181(-)